MIGKIPKAGRGFKGIISYLLNGARETKRQNDKQPALQDATDLQTKTDERPNATRNRVLWTETHNLITTDPKKAVRVMRATANRSRRCKSPVYHFVISWTPEEVLTTDLMRSIVKQTCKDMGLEDHQRIIIAHDDTLHRHVHVVVNRVHHDTGKAWNRAQDWVRLERSLAYQAKAHGLRYVPGRHNAPEIFKDQPKRTKDAEFQRARRKKLPAPTPQWSTDRLVAERKRVALLFDTAQSWGHLHDGLSAIGLSLRQKAQGYVLHDGSSEVKLSSISKTARIHLLTKRFGTAYQSHSRKNSSPVAVQKPAAPYVKPTHADANSTHPQLKQPSSVKASSSAVDQGLSVIKHTKVSHSQEHDGTSPKPRRHIRRKRRGPKL